MCYLLNFLTTFFQNDLSFLRGILTNLGRDGSLKVNFGVNKTSAAISASVLTEPLSKRGV